MTVEQHLRVIIGDLVIRVASLSAENDLLKEELEKLKLPETRNP